MAANDEATSISLFRHVSVFFFDFVASTLVSLPLWLSFSVEGEQDVDEGDDEHDLDDMASR